ncbi:MAG: glycosyltransferase family 2 protein [Patescibacteria group bacterium]
MKEIQLSVCIPTYEMHGEAQRLLTRSFDILKKQTFKNFEVIISDNSENDVVKNLCENIEYGSLDIKYFKNPQKGISINTNAAIKKASGEFIKILYMDDYLADQNSLQDIVDNFKGHWLVTGCGHDNGNGEITHTHLPIYNKKIYLGKNTIGAPSVLTIKNENPLMLDENLTWLLDCDYYKRLYDKYGEPDVLNKVNVIIGLEKHQTTNYLNYKIRWNEKWLMIKKHGKNELLKLLKLW